jgi:Carbohydrate-selective porin, OprB family
MTNILSKNPIAPILIAIAVWIAIIQAATAAPVNNAKSTNALAVNSAEATAEQIEQAAQATEVRPGDWAYQTLQTLGSKYSCGNTSGNQTLSREEFATGLNSCVQSIEQLVARRRPRRAIKKRLYTPAPAVVAPEAAPEALPPAPEPTPPPVIAPPEPQMAPEEAVTQQDLDRLKGLVQSFSAELQSVDSRVRDLDEKVAKLKDQSFSTTTKLNGEAIFAVSGFNTGRGIVAGSSSTIFNDRVRLNFDTSFMGKDRLRTRLQSRNTPNFATNNGTVVTGYNQSRLGYDGDENNGTTVSLLQYTYPLSPQTSVRVETVGSEFNENMYTFNPQLESSGSGAVSRFGRFNPVYYLSGNGAALTVNHNFSDQLAFSVGYAVPGAANIVTGTPATASTPTANAGIFNGQNVYIGQLNFRPSDALNLGLVYARSYTPGGIAGGTGSSLANSPFGSVSTTADNYSFLASYKVSPGAIVSGWANFINANNTVNGNNASVSGYALSLAFPDFGSKGNSLAFIVGLPPKLNSSGTTVTTAANPENTNSLHIEALYKVKVSDNLLITPGVFVVTNPNNNSANPTEYVGTIRSTFKF